MPETASRILEGAGVARVDPEELKALPAKATAPVLVAFVADWCEVSRDEAPVVAALADRYKGRVRFAFADVDRNAGDAGRLNVRSVPAAIIFAKERELGRKVGAATADDLARVVEKALEEYAKIGEGKKPDGKDARAGVPLEPAPVPAAEPGGKSGGKSDGESDGKSDCKPDGKSDHGSAKDREGNPMPHDFVRLNLDVVFGRSQGRIIWQPRIGCWLTDKQFAGTELPPRYRGMDLPAIYRDLGCSARLYDFNACFRRVEHPGVKWIHRELSDTDRETVIETPAGRQTSVWRRTVSNPHGIHLKREVETEQELKVAAWREENAAWEWDQAKYDELLGVWGGLGAPTMYLPRMNVQSLYIEKMGVERGVYAIYDWPDTVGAYFRALDECHDRLIDVVNASPVEIVNFGENVHGRTLSPELFKRYHLPSCQRRAERLHAGGKFVHAHWDGDVKPLLPFARETGLDGIEAITPLPQGDVTLEEVKDALGDMVLLDGIPAVYFDETYPVSVLEECARRAIELFAPRLVLGISDEISSTGDLERVRVVGKIVDDFNARFG